MDTIGRYRIEGSIGEGAMAHVYRAHDPSIDRCVAIKVLKPEFRANTEVVQRFLSESRAAGMLSHANIVTIYDVGEADDTPYIAMEYFEGRPLDEVLPKSGRFTSDRAATLGIEISSALAYAHSQGVIHRDIKPSNILISDRDGSAKLLDFGIARIDGRDVASRDTEAVRTQAGQVLGTPRYMSPEQALGLPVDARSDLFSLGVVLYEVITGKVAFTGTGIATLAIQIAQQQPVEIDRQVPDCPKGLRFIITKLLAKKPEQRFDGAAKLAQALRHELDSALTETGQPRSGLSLRFKMPFLLAACALLALGTGITVVNRQENAVMRDMAFSSGASITSFVAVNAALHVAENAGLPAAEQDWAPLQAFAVAASANPSVRNLIVADEHGVIRASGDEKLVGKRFSSVNLAAVGKVGKAKIFEASDGLRFIQPIDYAGAHFGHVDVIIERASLDAAQRTATLLLLGLAAIVTIIIALFGIISAQMLTRPLRRLRHALDEVTAGNLSFRISHHRRDEIGGLFDAANRMMGSLAERHENTASVLENAHKAMLMTRIEPGAAASHDQRAA